MCLFKNVNKLSTRQYLPLFTFLPFVRDDLYSEFIRCIAADPVENFGYGLAGLQVLNPDDCGSETTGFQMVKLV